MKRLLILLLACSAALAQQDQRPRQAVKDQRGLLKINRDMFDLAAATGGDFYFWAAGEFATANLQIPIHGQGVVLAYGDVDGKRVFEIPVESGVDELTLFAGVQRKDLAVLLTPAGDVVRDGIQSYQHMIIAVVKTPPAGVWKLELQGAGTYAVTAHVKSNSALPPGERFAVAKDGSVIMRLENPDDKPAVPYRIMTRGTGFQRVESQLRTP